MNNIDGTAHKFTQGGFKFRVLVTVFLICSALLFISRYLHFFEFTPGALGKYFPVKWILMAHIAGGATALLTGPFQLLKEVRNKYRKLHRVMGYVYIVSIILSSGGALALTFTTTNQVSVAYTISLWGLVFVWIASTGMAFWTIKEKKIQEHEEWMVRSYMVTFAFIVQNYLFSVPGFDKLGSFQEISPDLFWFSWSMPLFFYQLYLTKNKISRFAR
jgi:uncharacterized membrane protein